MKCNNYGKENKLLLLDILEYIVEQGNMNIWLAVSSKKFLSFIIDILKSQNDAEIQTKLLQLIQNWGTEFEINKNAVPNFYKVYNKFKVSGVVFPPREEPNYYKYILRNEESKKNYNRDDYEDKKNIEHEEEISPNNSNDDNEFAYIDSIKNKLKPSNFEHKYRRLVAFLVKMHDNIELANICIDRRKLGELKAPIDIIKKGNKTIMETITSGRLKNEKLMEITLGTTEDINQTLSREEELKKGNRPNFFTSYFVLNEIIPIKNKNIKSRAKSEKKKGVLNSRNDLNINDDNKKNNNNTNINDIFELFSSTKPKEMNVNPNYNTNLNNNTNNNQDKMISNYYTNQNINNNVFDDINNAKNNLANNYRINNNINSSKSLGQNNNDNRNSKINTFDLLGERLYINNQPIRKDNINQNNNFNLDMYGPAPETNSNQLVNYIEVFNNNNNNYNNNNNNNNKYINSNDNYNNISNNDQYPSFEGRNQNDNMFSKNNKGNNNNIMDQNNNNNGQKMTQEEIEREQRLKELDDLF